VPALALLAQFSNRDHALSLERLFSDYRGPLVMLAVGGFIIGVIGHLFRSKPVVVTGILLVFVALVAFPIVLYVRGVP
jgi:MFS-type transporter involved in bile tolerance (Atg22 family)